MDSIVLVNLIIILVIKMTVLISERSQEEIIPNDLKRLLKLSRSNLDGFFSRHEKYQFFKGKEVLIALCQGSALHFIDKVNGVKDFDVWIFYPKGPFPMPYRRVGKEDFGLSKFGKHPEDNFFEGRRIDILFRSDGFFKSENPYTVQDYLSKKSSKSSKELLKKPVIGLWPEEVFSRKLWPC